MFRKYAINLYDSWARQSEKTLLSFIEKNPNVRLLDLGCGDGKLTVKIAKKIGTKDVNAIEALPIKIKSIKTKRTNLNEKFPFNSNSFDVVISNYSIEHLYNTSLFISETYRVLRKGGYVVVATDNLASWPNIISLVFGYQAFSTTFMINGKSIGNPYALRVEGPVETGPAPDPEFARKWRDIGEFGHNKVLAYKGLIDAYKAHGFEIEKVSGVGYFPFKGFLSSIMARLDPRHSHLIILKAKKN